MAKLYVVPTPVGNLEDMTFRAISVLREVDCILAEDTRTSGILLKHFDIHTRMQSHHKFNEHQTIEGIVTRIEGGENIALISDAGTPAISDPGFLLVRECVGRVVRNARHASRRKASKETASIRPKNTCKAMSFHVWRNSSKAKDAISLVGTKSWKADWLRTQR